MTLIGSAIRLLCGETGVFVLFHEGFDLQSDTEYIPIPYHLDGAACSSFLASLQGRVQPTADHLLVVDMFPSDVAKQPGLENSYERTGDTDELAQVLERCSLFLHDGEGNVGILHCLRPAGQRSCFEQTEETLQIFVAQLAVGIRSAVQVQALMKEQELTREREREEQRSTFISVISHELQTPIAIIKGYASTLARSDAELEPEALRSRLVAIEEEADRLNKLVGNLLYASRIQGGGLQMEVAPLDLGRLIQSVVRRLQFKSRDVMIVLELPPNLPTVMADRDRIEEVLQNLLDNAVKYSPRLRVLTIACRVTSDEVIVSISDRGMGISLEDQERIFDRFQRSENDLTQITPGAGLGLYICRAIVEAHGGRIWVESTLRQGSTFFFSLPRVE
ncbi:MAG: ATP-binding protein, partial [Chloroflexota bacterium]|nr:ATP-binding protein [Chloroflexota bacterium]